MTLLVSLLLAQIPKPLADIPFELVDDHVYLTGTLNGVPVGAILDSGAATTVADDTLGTSVGAKKEQAIGVQGAGSDTTQAWQVSGLDLMLDGTSIRQPVPVVAPLASLDVAAGRPIRVILGTEFLKRYRVEIDYAAARLRVYDPGVKTVPAGATVLPLRLVDDLPFIKGAIQIANEAPQPVTMVVDTGDGSAFSVTNHLVRRLGLDKRFAKVPVLPSSLGMGGEIREKEVRFASITLGTLRLLKPVADLQMDAAGANGDDSAHEVSVGGEALRRFTVIFDYPHQRMMLTPNADFKEPFVGDEFGIGFSEKADGGFEVKFVVPGSPASEAGIVAGDEILEVDGRPIKNLQQARKATNAAKKDIQMKIRHAGVERVVVLKPRELVP